MKSKSPSILQLIKDDHKPLKESIKILLSEKQSENEKKKALKRFLMDLKLHAKAEEISVYQNVLNLPEMRMDILEATEEHAVADRLGMMLERVDLNSPLSDQVMARARVLAEIVQHHLKEEEEEMLPMLKEAMDRNQLLQMGEMYQQAYRQLKKDIASGKKISGPVRRRQQGSDLLAEILAPAPH